MPFHHFGRAIPITFRRFPMLNVYDLQSGLKMSIPCEMKGDYNILIIGFKRKHVYKMFSWVTFAHEMQRKLQERSKKGETISIYTLICRHPIYKLPYFYNSIRWQSLMKKVGFSQDKSITHLYGFLDHFKFLEEIQLPDSQRPYILMIKPDGEISWCEHEMYTTSKHKAIYNFIGLEESTESIKLPENNAKKLLEE